MKVILLEVKSLDSLEDLKSYLIRDPGISHEIISDVENILEGVRLDGDTALIRFIRKYDGYDPEGMGLPYNSRPGGWLCHPGLCSVLCSIRIGLFNLQHDLDVNNGIRIPRKFRKFDQWIEL